MGGGNSTVGLNFGDLRISEKWPKEDEHQTERDRNMEKGHLRGKAKFELSNHFLNELSS